MWVAGNAPYSSDSSLGLTTWDKDGIIGWWGYGEDWVIWTDTGESFANVYKFAFPGIRPVICLKSGVTLEKVGDKYNLIEPPPITAETVAEEPTTYYGATVNYTTPAGDPNVGWRILHSDGENIYLMADDYVHYTYVPEDVIDLDYYPAGEGGNMYTEYNVLLTSNNSGLDSIMDSSFVNPMVRKWVGMAIENGSARNDYGSLNFTATLLKTSSWDPLYCDGNLAEYSIGGPPIEMLYEANKTLDPGIEKVWARNLRLMGRSVAIRRRIWLHYRFGCRTYQP